ncbi:replication protein [Carnimonas bestiolae]|uniref:replication protein n=1 Tax=Carnimonas bestiolae TaxID=3402172 RepID=UPI003EDB871A
MSNTAEIYKFPDKKGESSKVARLEDGYVRTATAIVEAFERAPLTSREARVVRTIERLTYGWQKPDARIPAKTIAERTGLSETNASAALNSLIRKRVVIRIGGSRSPVKINKQVDQWDFDTQKSRVTPNCKAKSKWSESIQNGYVEPIQNGETYKDKKDINTTSNEVEPISSEISEQAEPEKQSPRYPDCPHDKILDLWADIMADKRQHARGMWSGSKRAKALASRWKQGFKIKHDATGEYLYTDAETGVEWWGRFFKFLRKSTFLMADNNWFDLEWVCKRENFEKIMELKYHGDAR